jgi:hypothetical protein
MFAWMYNYIWIYRQHEFISIKNSYLVGGRAPCRPFTATYVRCRTLRLIEYTGVVEMYRTAMLGPNDQNILSGRQGI